MHKGQRSRDDSLCKSDVQVDNYLKLLLIKLNPVVFFLIAKSLPVCNFKSSVGEILSGYYLFIISSLKGHLYIMHDFVPFLQFKKHVKHPRRNVTLIKVADLLYEK